MPTQMTRSQVMKALEAAGDPRVRERYVRDGAGENVFGVLMGKVRALAGQVGQDHALGLELWATGNHEARLLACMLLDPEALTEKAARELVEPLTLPLLVDELVGRVLVKAPVAEALEKRWRDGDQELPRRAGWKLLAGRIPAGLAKDLDVGATLARIERELPGAPYRVKEGLNHCLVWIGLHLPEHRAEVIAIGERLGRWDTRPIPKGCTSSYAPEWIAAVLALRKGEKTEARKKMEAAAGKKKPAPAREKPSTKKAAPASRKSASKTPAPASQKRAPKKVAARKRAG
ncbi:DNA alkylation repair protein [Myxococcus sp. MISCRS1]|uniref:DNA alkylation repair protein n=1 Tax=Myxococcus sp. MISCRS1 TaxID=2996786 RepID=UPI0022701727|nr:DNA alkylation repair protein [Myxococcus sp. MISCRS1]MCY1003336.1 DNA alkylation repair protein [Myxococcus sp. MISCRS1]